MQPGCGNPNAFGAPTESFGTVKGTDHTGLPRSRINNRVGGWVGTLLVLFGVLAGIEHPCDIDFFLADPIGNPTVMIVYFSVLPLMVGERFIDHSDFHEIGSIGFKYFGKLSDVSGNLPCLLLAAQVNVEESNLFEVFGCPGGPAYGLYSFIQSSIIFCTSSIVRRRPALMSASASAINLSSRNRSR